MVSTNRITHAKVIEYWVCLADHQYWFDCTSIDTVWYSCLESVRIGLLCILHSRSSTHPFEDCCPGATYCVYIIERGQDYPMFKANEFHLWANKISSDIYLFWNMSYSHDWLADYKPKSYFDMIGNGVVEGCQVPWDVDVSRWSAQSFASDNLSMV